MVNEIKMTHYHFFHYLYDKNKQSHLVRASKRFILKTLLWLTFICSSSLTYAKDIIIASDIWCPYICQDAKKPGYIVEMMNDILADKKFHPKNEMMPLARAIKYLQSGDVDIVLGLTQQHIDHHLLIRSNMSVGTFANDFFVDSTNPWRYSTIEQLEEYANNDHPIGIIKGYFYGDVISELIAKNPNLFSYSHGNAPLQQNIKRLKSGRISILLDSKNTILNEVKRLNISTLSYAGTQGSESELYVGLSSNADKELLQIIDHGISQYRLSGKLDKLLENYGITDWQ